MIDYKLSVIENIVLAMQHNPTDNWVNTMLPEYFFSSTSSGIEKKADEIVEQFFLSDVKNSAVRDL